MGRIIAVANQKGGVGKSTTAINLSACLAEKGQKVLTIDIDPQGNTTSGLGVDKNAVENTLYELLLGESEVKDTIIKEVIENVDLIASNINLSGAEIELIGVDEKEYILKKVTDKVRELRLHYHGLSSFIKYAYNQCINSSNICTRAHTVRILCAGRLITVNTYH